MTHYDSWNNICFVLFWIFAAFTGFLFYGAIVIQSEGLATAGILWSLPTFMTLLYSGRLI